MSENPVYTDPNALRVPVPQAAPQPSRAPIAGALGRLGGTLAKFGEAVYRHEQDALVLRAQVDAAKGFQEIVEEASSAPTFAETQQIFENRAGELEQRIRNLGGDDRTQGAIGLVFERSGLKASARISSVISRKKAEAYLADETQRVAQLQREALESPEMAKEELEGLRDASVRAGARSMDRAEVWYQQQVAQIDEAAALSRITRDPVGAMAALAGDEEYPDLNPIRREQLLSQAINAAAQSENRMTAEVRREQARVAGELWTAHAEGELTTQDVIAKRDQLALDEYKQLLRSVSAPPAPKDDPATYNRLLTSIYNGEESRASILEANASGLLTGATAKSLLDENQQQQTEGPQAVPGPLKSTRKYLREMLGGGGFRTLDPGEDMRLAQATWEYDEWARQNPAAGAREAREEADRLVRRFSLVDFTQNTISRPLPYGAPLARNAYTTDTLIERRRQLKIDYEAGRIGEQKYHDEKRNLNIWYEQTLERERKLNSTEEGSGAVQRR